MDPEFAKLVDDPEVIKTSGRWAAANEEIKRLAANPGADNVWYVELLSSLCYNVFSEYLLIKNAHEEKRRGDASLLAWRARNLLELLVWSMYCSKSRTTLAAFMRTRAVTCAMRLALSKHGERKQRNLLTGWTLSRTRDKTCRNGCIGRN
jgi:hypothetical protein